MLAYEHMIKLKAPTFEEEIARMKEEAGKWCIKGHWVFEGSDKLSVMKSEYCEKHNIHEDEEDTIDVGDEDHIDFTQIPPKEEYNKAMEDMACWETECHIKKCEKCRKQLKENI